MSRDVIVAELEYQVFNPEGTIAFAFPSTHLKQALELATLVKGRIDERIFWQPSRQTIFKYQGVADE